MPRTRIYSARSGCLSAALRASVGLFVLSAISSTGQTALQERPVPDEQVNVLHFQRMDYPLYAKVRHIEGVVVVQASVDSTGQVIKAVALSGPKALLKGSVDNLRKWRFAASRQTDVIAVYWFRFSGLCEPPCPSGFEFHPPSLVIVTTGNQVVTE
jgi:outer membrane biosynthesis protein TonB